MNIKNRTTKKKKKNLNLYTTKQDDRINITIILIWK